MAIFHTDLVDLWVSWRKDFVRHDSRIEWDLNVLAVYWVIWNEKNNRIFSQKHRRTSSALIDAIHSFITFLGSELAKELFQGKERRKQLVEELFISKELEVTMRRTIEMSLMLGSLGEEMQPVTIQVMPL